MERARVSSPPTPAPSPSSDLKPFAARLADYLVLAKVRQALGFAKCRKSFYGAAPMTAETQRFFLGLNIRLYSGYGLSETSGPHFMSSPCNFQLYRYPGWCPPRPPPPLTPLGLPLTPLGLRARALGSQASVPGSWSLPCSPACGGKQGSGGGVSVYPTVLGAPALPRAQPHCGSWGRAGLWWQRGWSAVRSA